jgi:hypothetical protein
MLMEPAEMAKLDYPVVAETGMRRNEIMNQVNQLILYVSKTAPVSERS